MPSPDICVMFFTSRLPYATQISELNPVDRECVDLWFTTRSAFTTLPKDRPRNTYKGLDWHFYFLRDEDSELRDVFQNWIANEKRLASEGQ